MLTALVLAIRIAANPVSNVFQKQLVQRSADPVFVIAATHGWLTLVSLPLLLGAVSLRVPPAFWADITIAAVLAVSGNALLVAALENADLSLLGPVNAYKSVVSLVPGMLLVGEVPSMPGLGGIALILAGSYLVVDRRVGEPRRNAFVQFFRERGVQLRFAALVLSATEAVFLKRALLQSSPLTTFVCWSILGLPIAGAAVLATRPLGRGWQSLRTSLPTYLGLALTTGAMQLATLVTFGRIQVGYSLALFQLSTPVSVFLGHRYFQEGNIRKRLAGSVVMAAGAMLIVLFGR